MWSCTINKIKSPIRLILITILWIYNICGLKVHASDFLKRECFFLLNLKGSRKTNILYYYYSPDDCLFCAKSSALIPEPYPSGSHRGPVINSIKIKDIIAWKFYKLPKLDEAEGRSPIWQTNLFNSISNHIVHLLEDSFVCDM